MSTAVALDNLRLVGVGGTNKVMAGELSRLASRASLRTKPPAPRKQGLGSLLYPFDPELAALAVRYHRTSTRVLWDLYESRAERLEPLYEDLLQLVRSDDRGWVIPGFGISVGARGVEEFAAGGRQVVGTVKNALIEGASQRGIALHVDADNPDLLFDVRLREGAICVSIDLAGRPMSQRGYRQTGGVAPLNESLAAVLVMLGRHQARTEPLIDPMAGSGTIAIEAVSMGRASPVWIAPRKPSCMRLPALRSLFIQAPEPMFPDTQPVAIANEIEKEAFDSCRDHASRAGVENLVHAVRGDFRDLETSTVHRVCQERGMSAATGLILSNPPYGERLDSPELLTLYRDLGRWCRQFRGWRAAFLIANPEFERVFGGRPRIKKPLNNAQLRSSFLMYDL
jgi:23S rRNA G2445 N2-methylase RlmL